MKRYMAILAVLLAPGAVCAQGTAHGWPGLDAAHLQTVFVLDDMGIETSGKFLRLNPDSLVLLVGSAEHHFDAARVRRIDKRGDSLRNGALIGAIVGAAVGLVGGGISDCPGNGADGCSWTMAAAVVLSTGVYTAIGAGIDALVSGRTTLYEAPATPPPSGSALYRSQTSITLRVRW